MIGRLHIGLDFLNATVWPDEERHAVRAHVFATEKTFLPPNSIGLDDLFVFIGQQGEREFVFGDEFRVRFR